MSHPGATEERILVLQGGGALGAYQAGVHAGLDARGDAPDWVAGISIGAINAALIAGNAPEHRTERLRAFWERVTHALPVPDVDAGALVAQGFNQASALRALLFGVPGFFVPHWPPAMFALPGTTQAISVYDTAPLRETLEALVDFDRINAGPVRLSVGAVNVRTGNFAYFDSGRQRIDVRHILASGALPPGFPPVEIDGEHYWDGGLVSNTPLQYVLDQPGERPRIVFQVDLFPARGDLPRTLMDVAAREKDIRFSSRTRMNTDVELRLEAVARAATRLAAKLPPALRDDPDARFLADLRPAGGRVDIVHLIYRTRACEGDSKDFEFSRRSMRAHWSAGHDDVCRTLDDARWQRRGRRRRSGVRVFDLLPAGPHHPA
jgi:NTE family protein